MAPWEDYLKEIYFDPKHPGSFAGPQTLYKAAKYDGIYNIGMHRIRKFLHNQESYSLHKPVRRRFQRNHVISAETDDLWMADLIDMVKCVDLNQDYKYILLVIDMFSKYVWLRPLKSKTGEEVAIAFKDIFMTSNRSPAKLITDKGKRTYFYLTLAFILIPAVILVIADLTWLYIDNSLQKNKRHNQTNAGEEGTGMIDHEKRAQHKEIDNTKMQDVGSPLKVVCRIILGLLSWGIIVRILQHMRYKCKKRKVRQNRDYYSERVMTTKRDYAMLNFICAFTETYSQAALQLYIFHLNPVSLYSKIGFSIITSILFMPLAFADHYRSSRLQSPQGAIDKSRDMNFTVYFFYYLGVLGGMMFRIVSISMFYAAVSPTKIYIPLLVVFFHWCCVFIWLWFYHKPSYAGMLITQVPALRIICKCLYTALYSMASMLFFVDLYEREGKRFPSKNRMICYNVVLYVESGVFIVLGFVWAGLDIQLYAMVLLVGFLLHVVLIANYYQFLHPTVGVCYACAATPAEHVEQIVTDPPQSDPGSAATG